MSCCPEGSHGAVQTLSAMTPVDLNGTKVFFYDNTNSEQCVLVFTDIFGPDSGRIKSNCAKLSASYKVALLDLSTDYMVDFNGVPDWIRARPFETLLPKIDAAVQGLQIQHGVKRFVAIGYCWGAWVAAKYSGVSANILTCVVNFHPAWTAEGIFRGEGSGIKMADSITCPHMILAAGNDPSWLKPGGEVEAILTKKVFGPECVFRVFENMTHGWSIRGDMNDPEIAAAVHEAWDECALPYLQKQLGK